MYMPQNRKIKIIAFLRLFSYAHSLTPYFHIKRITVIKQVATGS
jgi:hypothetical protein